MPIHFGNNKIDKLFYGDIEIKEVYLGSDKIYQNIKGIPVWRFTTNQNYILYLLCEYSMDGYVILSLIAVATTIRSINGVIGQSGSSIVPDNDPSWNYSFSRVVNINNKIFYEYIGSQYNFGKVLVLPNSEVNDTVLSSINGTYEVTSLTDSAITVRTAGMTVNGIKDNYFADWTRDGLTER